MGAGGELEIPQVGYSYCYVNCVTQDILDAGY